MRSSDRAIARKQLDRRLHSLYETKAPERPPRGWIKAIRDALGMTTAQVAERIGVSQPRVVEIEKAEKAGVITLDTLERAAHAMDCELVYALVPRQPLQEMITERARVIAQQRLAVIGHHMALEAQSVAEADRQEQFEQLVKEIVEKAGSNIWKREHD